MQNTPSRNRAQVSEWDEEWSEAGQSKKIRQPASNKGREGTTLKPQASHGRRTVQQDVDIIKAISHGRSQTC